jgi:hypothetical protein
MNSFFKARPARIAIPLLGSLWIATAAVPARAGIFDSLFGTESATEGAKPAKGQRLWVVREFSEIRLTAREPGTPPNQHPAQISPDVLRQQLALVRFAAGNATRPLFTADEAAELAGPLSEALASAGEADDVLLLSSARRSDAPMYRPVAVTARLFVQSGALQFIVNDARYEFFDRMRGTHQTPEFTYGSRTRTGTAVLQDDAATRVRADWLAIAVTARAPAPAAVAPAAPPAPAAAAPAVAPAARPAAVAPAAPPAAPAATPAARPHDAAFIEEIERRLINLKRLRDGGLITEEEYQQKRKEILSLL